MFFGWMRVKGEIMAAHACIVAFLMGVALGQEADVRPPNDPEILLSAGRGLADTDRFGVVLALCLGARDHPPIGVPALKVRLAEKLNAAGIRPIQGETGPAPRLVVRIENTLVPDCDKCVCRVQVSLMRPVILPNQPEVQIQAEVWQGQPVTAVVARPEAAEAVSTAVLAQVGAFTAAHRAARSSPASVPSVRQDFSAPPAAGSAPAGPPQTTSGHSFVSSKSSEVFHRADCRWAQGIAADNRVGYKSREEAVQAGKRPCKTCKP
jgi:hypothetical protein